MAIGDKRPVVMQSDRAANGGIATLDSKGNVPFAQLGNVTNPNLLDNWDFVNAVNQRGVTAMTNDYGIDRWIGLNVTATVSGVVFGSSGSRYLFQRLESDLQTALDGRRVTFSALVDDDIIVHSTTFSKTGDSVNNGIGYQTAVVDGENVTEVLLSGLTGTVKAVKFELGDTQTLAHKEGGVWVLNEIPDYGEELRKCRRYYYVIRHETSGNWAMIGQAWTTKHMNGFFSIPPMRAKPTPIVDVSKLRVNFGSSSNTRYGVESFLVPYYKPEAQQVCVDVAIDSEDLTIGNTYALKADADGVIIAFSADL